MGRILIGTCSWTDRSLLESGLFYPPPVKTPETRLRYYSANFPTVEVDSSYYALPSRRNSELWVQRTPPGFIFHVKAYALFTGHAADPRALPRDLQAGLPRGLLDKGRVYMKDLPPDVGREAWALFLDALSPLMETDKLGMVLFQFPPWFHPGRSNRELLLECRERLPGCRLAVEFRNAAWMEDGGAERTLGFLRDHGLTYVCVDSPAGFRSSVPPVAAATTDVGYVRFHGRNSRTWERRGEGGLGALRLLLSRRGAGGVGAAAAQPPGRDADYPRPVQHQLPGPGDRQCAAACVAVGPAAARRGFGASSQH